jgi:hypothetical protein
VESYRTRNSKVRWRAIIKFGLVHRYTKEEIPKTIRELSRFFKLEDKAEGEGVSFETSHEFAAP